MAEDTYILSPHFAGGHLFWVERLGDQWQLHAMPMQVPGAEKIVIPVNGRPLSLNSCPTADGALLVWEERQGKRTRLRLARLVSGAIRPPVDLTDGSENAYDPACCIAADGSLHVIYCAFHRGNYRILIQRMNIDGLPADAPVVVSNQVDACVHPSICARRDGGVWFSYTCLHGGKGGEHSYVLHPRYLGQRAMFSTEAMLYAGLLVAGRTFAPLAPPNPGGVQGWIAAMIVYGSESGGRSQVFEDAAGRLRLLARQHLAVAEGQSETADTRLR